MNKILNYLDNKKIYTFLLIISSFTFTYYSGVRGIFPIDSFLIFNGGYKILNNLHPFKDYWSITGPLLDYLQAIIFRFFNVNWISYIFHAALFNAIITLSAFYFFIFLKLKNIYSFVYAFSISILAYPSVGTPFMDHHATILSVISLILLIMALKKDKNLYWFLIPVVLGLSFLSKQIPSAYFVILFSIVTLIFLFIEKFKNLTNLIYIFYGLFSFLLFFMIWLLFTDVSFKNFLLQYFFYPLSIGEMRGKLLNFDLANIFFQFKFIYISLIPILFSGYYLILKNKKTKKNNIDILILFTLFTSIIIFIYSQLLTKNQILIFFLIPFYLAMGHYFSNNYIKKHNIIFLIMFILIISTLKFHLRFNVEKKFMEMSNVDFKLAIDGSNLDQSFRGLKWITPLYPDNPVLEIGLLKDTQNKIIKEENNNFIMTDYLILPFLTDSKKFAPNKWFDDQSVPDKKSLYFKQYKDFFLRRIKEENITVIFIVGNSKENFLKNIFSQENCLTSERLNELTQIVDIKRCLN